MTMSIWGGVGFSLKQDGGRRVQQPDSGGVNQGWGGGDFQRPSQTPDFKPTQLERQEAAFHTPLLKCKTVTAGLLSSSAAWPGQTTRPWTGAGAMGQAGRPAQGLSSVGLPTGPRVPSTRVTQRRCSINIC